FLGRIAVGRPSTQPSNPRGSAKRDECAAWCEKLIAFLQKEHPEALPHSRQISLKEARGGTEDAALAGEPLKRIRPA
ncbi:MAG: hypothetical protein WB052_10290, partial [Pseudolabrys sp.]